MIDLADRWRDRVEDEPFVSPEVRTAVEACAEELEDWIRSYWMEPLTVQEAADFGGYSKRRLYEMLRKGEVPNAGNATTKRILRKNVPIKRLRAEILPPTRSVNSNGEG